MKARRRWPSWRSSSTFNRTRSRSGAASLLEGAAGVFGSDGHSEPAEPAIDVKTLHAKIVN